MVAEDHQPLLIGIQQILETAGYTVLTASDGLEALQILEHTQPDLILADIMMPVLDGYALFEQVRGRPEWAGIPVVFLTSKADTTDIRKAKELGVKGYITKPFDPSELLVAVHKLLSDRGLGQLDGPSNTSSTR
jgi:CheY-like chemotaxis protein